MAKPTTKSIAAALAEPERILLFCLASGTDWQAASITHATAQQMMVRGLIERQAATRYVLTKQGRAALAAMISRSRLRGCGSRTRGGKRWAGEACVEGSTRKKKSPALVAGPSLRGWVLGHRSKPAPEKPIVAWLRQG